MTMFHFRLLFGTPFVSKYLLIFISARLTLSTPAVFLLLVWGKISQWLFFSAVVTAFHSNATFCLLLFFTPIVEANKIGVPNTHSITDLHL
jgi:hypothetical protein